MSKLRLYATCASVVVAFAAAQAVQAQTTTGMASDAEALMAMSEGALENEIGMRYEAALAASLDPAIINSGDTRYLWAIEAKAQCGIALGYLKSSTKDPVSIGKCARAYQLMQIVPAPRMMQQPPVQTTTVRPEQCAQRVAGIVFFEWDSADVPADAGQKIDFIRNNYQACGWSGFDVVGHTDLSGSDAYNDGLSQRRANAVATMMSGAGIPGSMFSTDAKGESSPRVPTADGVREPQNRRVEITVR